MLTQLSRGELELSAVISAPRWVVGSPDTVGTAGSVFIEPGAAERCGDLLEASGFKQVVVHDLDGRVGNAQYIVADAKRTLMAASDPRADGSAICV